MDLRKRYKVSLSQRELGTLYRMVVWYLNTLGSVLQLHIMELASLQRTIKLAQKLQLRLLGTTEELCKLSLNIQETATLYEVLSAVTGEELGALERSLCYKLFETMRNFAQ